MLLNTEWVNVNNLVYNFINAFLYSLFTNHQEGYPLSV